MRTFILVAGLILIVVGTLFAFKSSFDPFKAQHAVENLGLKQVQMTGYRFFGCDSHDLFHYGFSAINPQGQAVTGVVCSGFLKGFTVRFD